MFNKRLGDKVYGYYETAEGRDFLKFCYRRYLSNRQAKETDKVSHAKPALEIALKNPSEQAKEDAKTLAALRRWAEGGQEELWKDKRKNLMTLGALEGFLIDDPDIADLMEDRALTLERENFISSMNLFFNTAQSKHSYALLRQKLAQYVGVFSIEVEYGERHERLNPYFYVSDNYFRAELHAVFPVIAIQEFCILKSEFGRIRTEQRAGFACINETGEIFRFMISNGNPAARWIEMLKPKDHPPNAKHLYAGDRLYGVKISPVNGSADESINSIRRTMSVGSNPLNYESLCIKKADKEIYDYVNKSISGIQWDIVL